MVTNTSLVAEVILPQAGTNLKGWKLGWVDSGAKTAQNDTWTVTNATEVKQAWLQIDASGAAEPYTVSTNVIVLTSATGTAASGLILFR